MCILPLACGIGANGEDDWTAVVPRKGSSLLLDWSPGVHGPLRFLVQLDLDHGLLLEMDEHQARETTSRLRFASKTAGYLAYVGRPSG